MKKTLIIGAASLALAAMPVVGAFAATTFTDTVTITVSEACSLSRSSGSGTYTATLAPNAVNANVGSSTLSAACNNPKGYTVKVATTALTNSTVSSYTIPYSTTTPAAGTSAWTVTKGASSATTNIANNGTVMETSAADTSTTAATQQVTYKVSTSNIQAQGSYSGTAVYTLTKKN